MVYPIISSMSNYGLNNINGLGDDHVHNPPSLASCVWKSKCILGKLDGRDGSFLFITSSPYIAFNFQSVYYNGL